MNRIALPIVLLSIVLCIEAQITVSIYNGCPFELHFLNQENDEATKVSTTTNQSLKENGTTQIQLELDHGIFINAAAENASFSDLQAFPITVPMFSFNLGDFGVTYSVSSYPTNELPATLLAPSASGCANLTLSASEEGKEERVKNPCLAEKYAVLYCIDLSEISDDDSSSTSSIISDGEKIGEKILPFIVEAIASA